MKPSVTLLFLSAGLLSIAQTAESKQALADPTTALYADQAAKASSYSSVRKGWHGRSWMQQQSDRRENRQSKKAYMLPGSEISAETETAYAINKYHETPEEGWTPLHQKIYDELLSGDVAAALQSVRQLKQEGSSVGIPIPHDIRRRTLHAAAFDIDKKFFNGRLELRPEWPSLIKELQSEQF